MRIRLEQPILDEFFGEIRSRKDFVNWKEFSKRIKSTSYSTINQIRLDKRTFPEETFKEILETIDKCKRSYFISKTIKSEDFWAIKEKWRNKLSKSQNDLESKISLKHLELKARICGYLAGDGTLFCRKNRKQESFRYDIGFFPDELDMANSFRQAFNDLYGKELAINKRKEHNNYVLRVCSKVAYSDLTKIAVFGMYKWRVPFEFLKTREMKSEWLRGFFDAEAHVNKQNKIQIQSVNKNGLQDVKDLLKSIGLEPSKIYEYKRKNKNWNTNYLLEIRRKAGLRKYLNLVGFNHSIKKAKLKAIVAEVPER